MNTPSKLEVHRHQAIPQKLWLTIWPLDAQLGALGSCEFLIHNHSQDSRLIPRPQLSAKGTGEGCTRAPVQDHPGALRSSAASACLTWSPPRGCLSDDQADVVGMTFAVRAPARTYGLAESFAVAAL